MSHCGCLSGLLRLRKTFLPLALLFFFICHSFAFLETFPCLVREDISDGKSANRPLPNRPSIRALNGAFLPLYFSLKKWRRIPELLLNVPGVLRVCPSCPPLSIYLNRLPLLSRAEGTERFVGRGQPGLTSGTRQQGERHGAAEGMGTRET